VAEDRAGRRGPRRGGRGRGAGGGGWREPWPGSGVAPGWTRIGPDRPDRPAKPDNRPSRARPWQLTHVGHASSATVAGPRPEWQIMQVRPRGTTRRARAGELLGARDRGRPRPRARTRDGEHSGQVRRRATRCPRLLRRTAPPRWRRSPGSRSPASFRIRGTPPGCPRADSADTRLRSCAARAARWA
jgi:hypothetical protein